jgi:hypothetical protein
MLCEAYTIGIEVLAIHDCHSVSILDVMLAHKLGWEHVLAVLILELPHEVVKLFTLLVILRSYTLRLFNFMRCLLLWHLHDLRFWL